MEPDFSLLWGQSGMRHDLDGWKGQVHAPSSTAVGPSCDKAASSKPMEGTMCPSPSVYAWLSYRMSVQRGWGWLEKVNAQGDTQVISQTTIIQGSHTWELSHAVWLLTRARSVLKPSFSRVEFSEPQLSEHNIANIYWSSYPILS